MPKPPPDALGYRDLLARLDREVERIRDENESLRPDAEAEEVARRVEEDLRGLIPGNARRALLPANADPLAPQDPSRRALFARHLAEIAGRPRLPEEPAASDPPPSGRESLSANVCAACRGSCCRSGGDHAYLTEETIARQLQAHPERTTAQVVELYLERLPAETVRNSCIYHAATGCGLPRSLRSETCNRHLCGKLQTLRASLPEQDPAPVLAVLFDGGTWARTALIDEAGFRILAEETPDRG